MRAASIEPNAAMECSIAPFRCRREPIPRTLGPSLRMESCKFPFPFLRRRATSARFQSRQPARLSRRHHNRNLQPPRLTKPRRQPETFHSPMVQYAQAKGTPAPQLAAAGTGVMLLLDEMRGLLGAYSTVGIV